MLSSLVEGSFCSADTGVSFDVAVGTSQKVSVYVVDGYHGLNVSVCTLNSGCSRL